MKIVTDLIVKFINHVKEKSTMSPLIIGIIFIVVAGAIGYGSTFFLGNDNPIEEEAEVIVEEEVETVLHLPPGSEKGKIPLGPKSKQMNES